MTTGELDRRIEAVVASGNCSGCGACCLLDGGLEMRLNGHGYARPVRTGPSDGQSGATTFDRVCPGRTVSAQRPDGSTWHPLLGPAVASWRAWATDPGTRFAGSSGGVITAVTHWLLRTGEASEVVAARKAEDEPRRTVSVTLRTPSAVIGSAGSRYAPASNAAAAVLGKPDAVFVGKPCEVAAVRALAEQSGVTPPLLVSFFCAGTPSQHATDGLVERLADGQAVTDLWYRGHGWPGRFTVTRADGSTGEDSYDHSWGKELGPTVQWRCKICPDGVGESADLVAGDFWESDADGYPLFDEQDGISAVIARTRRGRDVLERAFAAGVLEGGPLDLDELAGVQPGQVERRRTLAARLAGARLAGRPVPRFRGFRLLLGTRGRPRQLARIAAGSYRRITGGRADG